MQDDGSFRVQKFLIDTRFTGSCIYILAKNEYPPFAFEGLQLLDEGEWVQVADGRKAKTFKAFLMIEFNDVGESIEVNIIEATHNDHAVLGIEFLRENGKPLCLNFKDEIHRLV